MGKSFFAAVEVLERPQNPHTVRAASPERAAAVRGSSAPAARSQLEKAHLFSWRSSSFLYNFYQMLQLQRIFVLIRRNKSGLLETLPALPRFLCYAQGCCLASAFAKRCWKAQGCPLAARTTPWAELRQPRGAACPCVPFTDAK